MFKFNYNYMDIKNSNGLVFSSLKKGCYIEDCFIKPKPKDVLFSLVDDGMNSWLVPTLRGYAIIPKDEFDEYLKWKNRKTRVLNLGGK